MSETCYWLTDRESETKQIAAAIAEHLQPGDVLALQGDLGVGKTVFAKGIAEQLGIDQPIDSPTFTIVKEYQGRLPFYHLDVYRIEELEMDWGLEDYLYGEGICLIEWASRIESLLPEHTIWVRISVEKEGSRRIELHSDTLCSKMKRKRIDERFES